MIEDDAISSITTIEFVLSIDSYVVSRELMNNLFEYIEQLEKKVGDVDTLETATKCCRFGGRDQATGEYRYQVTVKAPYSWLADAKCVLKAKACGFNSGGASSGRCSEDRNC
jgi:hypothetical protein